MKKILTLVAFATLLAGCGQGNTDPSGTPSNVTGGTTTLANPASTNCTSDPNRTLEIKTMPDGSQYGVCYFDDNRQCEEWAFYNGDCPAGGVKITGYDTDAQIYCAITGGEVDMDAGTCTLKGTTCKTNDYYNTGKCTATDTGSIGLANPASTYCADQGGDLQIKTLPSGGEYGVCYFDDNRQCEEWAMYSGDCPIGGLKITGYDTDAQIYCAIRGGEPNVDNDTCTINGATCSADDYYNNNKCESNSTDSTSTSDLKSQAQAHCSDENISMVYECGDYYGVVSSLDGGGTTFYLANGTSFSCPVVAPDSMSDNCRQYVMGSNCAEINLCTDSNASATSDTPVDAQTVFDTFSSDYQIDLPAPTTTTMEWRDEQNNITNVTALQVSMDAISREPDIFRDFFVNKMGFTADIYQDADGVGESQSGYKKDNLACLTHYKLVDGQYAVESAEITCGTITE